LKIVGSFNEDIHHIQKVEVHALSRPHNQDDDLIGVGLSKTKEKERVPQNSTHTVISLFLTN